MAGVRNPIELIKRVALPAAAFLVTANFAGYAIVGENGVMSWGEYSQQKEAKAVELARLETERQRLEHRARLLDPRNADPDLAEELVRRDLGLVRPDEVIIPLD